MMPRRRPKATALSRLERPISMTSQIVTAVIAVAALVVAVATFASTEGERQDEAHRRAASVEAIITGILELDADSVAATRTNVAPSSVADEFLGFMTEVRRAAGRAYDSHPPERIPEGWRVCLGSFEALWDDCVDFTHFTFDEEERVTDWSIGGVPLRALFTSVEEPAFAVDAGDHASVALLATLQHPGGSMMTSLFAVTRTDVEPMRATATFAADRFEDQDEEEAEVGGVWLGPSEVGPFDDPLWVVRGPTHGFVRLTYDLSGVPDLPEPATDLIMWLYLT